MSSVLLIRASYIIWLLCAISIVICLAYDIRCDRLIWEGLRKDYGDECCQRSQVDDAETDAPKRTSKLFLWVKRKESTS